MNKKSNKKLIISILVIAILASTLFIFRSCNKKADTNETVIEPTINEVVEVPNNTIQEEVIVEEVTTTEVKEEVKDNTTLSYWVNFLNKDGSVLQRTTYKYGETPSYKGTTPTYTDYAYYYSFKGWDKQTSPVKGTQTYTALYDIVGEVPSSKSSTSEPTVTPNYLTFTAETAGSMLMIQKAGSPASIDLHYSIDNGATWNKYFDDLGNYTIAETAPGSGDAGVIILTNIGDSVKFKGSNTSFSSSSNNYYFFAVSDSIAASGDVTSLLNGTGGLLDISNESYKFCFFDLFYGCDKLTTAPSLPSIKLAEGCYSNMFNGCISLTTAPALPATTLAKFCYNEMFLNCQGLKDAPALPATTLAEDCYHDMFKQCISLTTAPALPATTLAEYCYFGMFYGCEKLTTAPALPATTLAKSCYYDMFVGCSELTTAPTLPATDLADNCYSGMFKNCVLLTTPPTLPATSLATSCYEEMFYGCSGIKLSTTQGSGYTIEYKIPSSGTGTNANCALDDMFANTSGTFTGTPNINTTYYIKAFD